MTRRKFTFSAVSAVVAKAAAEAQTINSPALTTGSLIAGPSMEHNNGTFLMFLEDTALAPQSRTGFDIAVRGSSEGDRVHVRVFYNAVVPGVQGKVLLSKESTAPWLSRSDVWVVAGMHQFDIARKDVEFVEVTFLKTVDMHRIYAADIGSNTK